VVYANQPYATFSRKVIQAIIIVLLGVGVATVSDVEMNTGGTIAAVVGVVATSAQQILVGTPYKLKCSRPITRKRLVTTLGSYIN
jgi:hypothetical protein